MTARTIHGQIDNHSRAGEALTMGRRVGDCGYRPAHGERGVGSPGNDATTVKALMTSLVRHHLGGGLNRFPHFSNSFASRLPPSGRGDRRRVNAGLLPCVRLVATLSLRVLGRSSQFHRIGYQPGSYVSDPFERHSKRLSCASVADDATTPRKASHCAEETTQGLGNVRRRAR